MFATSVLPTEQSELSHYIVFLFLAEYSNHELIGENFNAP